MKLRVSVEANVESCQRKFMRAAKAGRLLSAKMLKHPGALLRKITDARGELFERDDGFVHLVKGWWLVAPVREPDEYCQVDYLEESRLMAKYVLTPELLETGKGIAYPKVRAVILRREFVLWLPDGLDFAQPGSALINWGFDPENLRRWVDENFQVIDREEWAANFEVVS